MSAAAAVFLRPADLAGLPDRTDCAALALGDSALADDDALALVAGFARAATPELVLFCGRGAQFHRDRFAELSDQAERDGETPFGGRARAMTQFDDVDFQLAAESLVAALFRGRGDSERMLIAVIDPDDPIEARLEAAIAIEAARGRRR